MKLFGRKTVAMACVLGVVGFAIVQARAQQVQPADLAQQPVSPSAPADQAAKKPDVPDTKKATNVDELQAQLDQTKKQRDEALADVAKQTKEAAAANATVTCMTGEFALRSTCLLDVVATYAGTTAANKAKEQINIAIAHRSAPVMPLPQPSLTNAAAPAQACITEPVSKPRIANQAPRSRVAAAKPKSACNSNSLFQ
jgi:hypothetical protein